MATPIKPKTIGQILQASSRAEKRKERLQARQRFARARKAEQALARNMRAVARQVGMIVRTMAPKGVVGNMPGLTHALQKYSEMLVPWARVVSERLITEVGQRDEHAWYELGETIGRNLRAEIRNAPTGIAMQKIMNEQVGLITSLPLHAARRVHKLTIEAMGSGERAAEIAKAILATGRVTESRAMLIARTETTRTVTATVQARARFIGSEAYTWRTSLDSDVRPEHQKMEGKVVRWDSPPVTEPNLGPYHAGAGPNCRCYPEPIIPDRV